MATNVAPDVLAILKSLRDAGLAWIADEVETTISNGKEEEKQYREATGRRAKTGTTTVPYTEVEQENILFRTLRAYFVDLYYVWMMAQRDIKSALKESSTIDLTIVSADGSTVYPFDSHFDVTRKALSSLLPSGSQQAGGAGSV